VEGLTRLHHGGGKHKVHDARRPAPKPAHKMDYPPAVHAGAQRLIELCRIGVGVALTHGFQAAAHVEAVSAQDGCSGQRSKVPIRGDPHALALHHAANEVGAAVHPDARRMGTIDIVLGPGALQLEVRLFIRVE